VKKVTSLPVIAVGLINKFDQTEAIVGTGDADLVALAIFYKARWPWHAAAHFGVSVVARLSTSARSGHDTATCSAGTNSANPPGQRRPSPETACLGRRTGVLLTCLNPAQVGRSATCESVGGRMRLLPLSVLLLLAVSASATQGTPPSQAGLSPEALSARIDAELKASKEHLEAVRDASIFSNRIFTSFTAILTVFGIMSYLRQRRQDASFEERLKESDRQRLEMHGLHHENLRQINELTSAVAAGARENVKTIHEMFTAIASILAFKAQEAKEVQSALDDMKAWRLAKEDEERQELGALKQATVSLRDSRHNYANPSHELQVRLDAYADRFDRMGDVLVSRLTRAKDPSPADVEYAEPFLRRGTIAYYANDVPRARSLLRTADRFFERAGSDAVKHNIDWARPCGFTKFYLALIEKNYGDMNVAKELIAASWDYWGKDNEREFLTPVVRAEILTSLGDIDAARASLGTMMSVVRRLREQGQSLPAHEAVYVARGHLILGDTFYIAERWDDAHRAYSAALEETAAAVSLRRGSPRANYYAHYALSQVFDARGQPEDAHAARGAAYEALIASGDLATKKALDTQILLNTLAFLCTRDSSPATAADYKATATQMMDAIRAIDGLELRLFSLAKKRHVSKSDFLKELLQPSVQPGGRGADAPQMPGPAAEYT
jgi:tetratricopeptide (TPR) repeat protein